jgi:hypothetical protein
MKTEGLQEAFRRVFSDENTRACFLTDPESTLGQFALTQTEKQAVLNTHHRLGLIAPDRQVLADEVDPASWWTSPEP